MSAGTIVDTGPFGGTPFEPTDLDPYFYGYRYVEEVGPDGKVRAYSKPLTEMDVLHPEEEDHIMQNAPHSDNFIYLATVLQRMFRDRPDVAVFRDHRVDWQVEGIKPHCSDFAVFEGLSAPWPASKATFYMKDAGARPLLVIEVTSPSSRRVDLVPKVEHYFEVGVPYYLIIDRRGPVGSGRLVFMGHRATPEGFVEMEVDPERGIWVPSVQLWFKGEGERVVCFSATGERILDAEQLADRSEAAVKLAEQEKARAEQERARAEQERARAEQAEARLAELERQLESVRNRNKA